MKPLRVYLDSSDLSVLSEPDGTTGGLAAIREQIRAFVDRREIICCFSGIHLSEAAPLQPIYADAAERRASLLVDLCGKNALLSLDRLVCAEIRHALGLLKALPDMHSASGEWYPDGAADISPVGAVALAGELRDAIRKGARNRKSRRAATAKALKQGSVRPGMRSQMANYAREFSLDEILEQYPMREDDARILARYAVGDATKSEAERAFMASLQDPRWMMRWFERHHDRLVRFIEWARNPAKSIVESFKPLAKHAAQIHRDDAVAGTSVAATLFSSSKWGSWQDELLIGVVTTIANKVGISTPSDFRPEIVDARCPGLSTGVRSLHSAWRLSVARTPRRVQPSDFVDALHAMYAPYVDVFRTDSFMAPVVSKFAERFGTVVVGKLVELPAAIEQAMRARGRQSPEPE